MGQIRRYISGIEAIFYRPSPPFPHKSAWLSPRIQFYEYNLFDHKIGYQKVWCQLQGVKFLEINFYVIKICIYFVYVTSTFYSRSVLNFTWFLWETVSRKKEKSNSSDRIYVYTLFFFFLSYKHKVNVIEAQFTKKNLNFSFKIFLKYDYTGWCKV